MIAFFTISHDPIRYNLQWTLNPKDWNNFIDKLTINNNNYQTIVELFITYYIPCVTVIVSLVDHVYLWCIVLFAEFLYVHIHFIIFSCVLKYFDPRENNMNLTIYGNLPAVGVDNN